MFNVDVIRRENTWVIYNEYKDKKIEIDNEIYKDLFQDSMLNKESEYFSFLLKERFFEKDTSLPTFEKINERIFENDIKNSDIVLLGIPYDAGSTGITGSKDAINKIRFETLKNKRILNVYDLQNILYIPGESIEEFHNRVEEGYRKIHVNNDKIISIGGDHSISYPIVKSFNQQMEINFFKFDAHHDSHILRSFERINHSNFMNFIRMLKNIKKIYHLGMREAGFENISEKDNFCEKIESKKNKREHAYISIDVDVLDPKIFQATGFLLKDGEQPEFIFRNLERIFNNYNVIGIDIVEYNPLIDNNKNFEVVLDILEFCISHWKG
ncbi:arginase family protein [Bacillus cereus group sp. Bce018]|uniref:arginase family protein n=1 Tax=Bacillus cereus group sp. Bce018 TaxID=3445248 RepID=UPI003310D208|nr:arginase family protein [Bacillus anthracis]